MNIEKNSEISFYNSENLLKEETIEEKKWFVVNKFYGDLTKVLNKKNISKADLAKKLDKSRSAITQLLNGTPNITINKMVELADACGMEIKIKLEDKEAKNKTSDNEMTKTIIEVRNNFSMIYSPNTKELHNGELKTNIYSLNEYSGVD